MTKFGIGWYWMYLKRWDDIYVLQARLPFFSIIHSYFSDDAGLVLTYIRYALPHKYETERPL